MDGDITSPPRTASGPTKRHGFKGAVTAAWSVCAKKAIKASRKLASAANTKIAPKPNPSSSSSPMARPKQLLSVLSSRALRLRVRDSKKRVGSEETSSRLASDDDESLDFGEGGLWQRNILMGDKCEPLDFSGVIYYDSEGKLLDEFPTRSPKASPSPGNFLFPPSPARKERTRYGK